jgi:MHS family alpha-ketoglutarate permease-like MFS transporter
MSATHPPVAAVTMGGRIKSILGGSIGNLIEWYDFYIYNFFALYFAKSFFPNSNPTAQLLNTFGIYAIGFLIRPVGGWVLGVYADRAGRRSALSLSVTLMCFGSLMIAVAPTFVSAGVWAPIILLAARLLQGISLGGEYGASATYLSEVAGAKNRGFYSSFQYVTLIGGQVLGSLTLLIMQTQFTGAELEAWAWRVPFFIGAACAIFGLYLRRGLVESAEFTKAASRVVTRPNPFRELLKHPRAVALVFGLTMGGTTAFYTYTTYMPAFLVNTVKLSRDQATQISFITLLIPRRRHLRPDRPPPGADVLRYLRNSRHRAAAHVAVRHARLHHRPAAQPRRAGCGHRLYLHQCCGEGRTVSRQCPRPRRRISLRPRGVDVRWHRALDCAVVQGCRP